MSERPPEQPLKVAVRTEGSQGVFVRLARAHAVPRQRSSCHTSCGPATAPGPCTHGPVPAGNGLTFTQRRGLLTKQTLTHRQVCCAACARACCVRPRSVAPLPPVAPQQPQQLPLPRPLLLHLSLSCRPHRRRWRTAANSCHPSQPSASRFGQQPKRCRCWQRAAGYGRR
jgi:hypothetical protein